jgi:hypothetical protein
MTISTYRLVLRRLKETNRLENLIVDGEGNIKMDLEELDERAVHLIYLAQHVGPIEICLQNDK